MQLCNLIKIAITAVSVIKIVFVIGPYSSVFGYSEQRRSRLGLPRLGEQESIWPQLYIYNIDYIYILLFSIYMHMYGVNWYCVQFRKTT